MKRKCCYTLFTMFFICLFAGILTQAAGFTPRTEAPSKDNKYYYDNSYNPFPSKGRNCTWYAYGRAYELLGSAPNVSRGDASEWWNYNKTHGCYPYGQEPKLGAIACYNGHVGIVEKIENGVVTTSNSEYGGAEFRMTNVNWYTTKQAFQGYIYIGDFEGETPVDLGDDFYAYIINTATWKHLTNEGGNVSAQDLTGGSNQIWRFQKVNSNTYKILSVMDGRCLEVWNFGTTSGTNVQVLDYNGNNAQLWNIFGESARYIFKAKCTDCVLDYDHASSNIQMWERLGNDHQYFQVWKLDFPEIRKPTLSVSMQNEEKNVVFSWNSIENAQVYDLRIYQNDNEVHFGSAIKGTSYEVKLEPGKYKANIAAVNTSFVTWTFSDDISFEVLPRPQKSEVRTLRPVYTNEHDVTIFWNSTDNTHHYWLTVKKDGETFFNQGMNSATSHTLYNLDDGIYDVTVQSCREPYITTSDVYTFCVNTLPKDFYATIKDNNDKKFVVNSNENVAVENKSDDIKENQIWHFIQNEDGTFTVLSAVDGKALAAEETEVIDGTNAVVVTDNGKYHWFVGKNQDGSNFFQYASNIAMGLDIDSKDYKNVQLWERHVDYGNQKFTVEILPEIAISYDANGGTGAPSAQTKTYGEKLTLSSTKPVRAGYDFVGWNTKADGSGISYNPGSEYTIDSSATLYAQWGNSVVAVTGVSLNKPTAKMTVGDSETLTATVAPSNATNKSVTWKSSNTAVATVENGVVKAEKAGNATITVTTADGGKTASCEVTVTEKKDEHSADIAVGNVSGKAGDTVTVPVVISNNPGIAAFKLKVTYDKEKLTPVSITKGSILSGAITSNIQQGGDMTRFDYVTAYWDNPSDFTADGELFNVVFKIADSAEEGNIPVGVLYVNGEIANQKFEDVDLNVTGGNVSVRNVMMGDIFEDGEVNSKDGLKLRQYLAEWDVNLSESAKAAADVFKDGEINSKDGLKLRQFLAEWDVSLEMVSLMGSGSISFEAGSANAAIGEYVDIPINITENSGVAVFNLRVEFDKEKLIPVSITKGDALSGVITSNIQQGGDMERFNYVTAYWDSPSNVTGTGTAFTVRFKVKDGAKGEAPIRLTSKAGDICDQSFNDLEVKFTDGAVTVDAVSDVVAVIVDSVETNYGSFVEAVNAANSAGKAVELKVLADLDSASIESEYKHVIDLNSNTVNELNVTGEVVIKNGTVNTLNVTGIAVTENVTVGNTNAVCSGTDGTKSVYTSYALGVSMINGAQVRVGGGLAENGTIDSKSGLRFIAECDRNDTFVSKVLDNHYVNNTYAEGYGIGIAISSENSENAAYVPAVKWQNEDKSVFTAAVTSIASNNFNRKFTARAYVEYDGVKLYSAQSSTRSMYQVAAGLLKNESLAVNLIDVLNMYVNQTGVRLTFTAADGFSARMTGLGAYTGDAFFTVGETTCEEGIYMVNITPIGSAKIDVDLFNKYVRINNNNSVIKPAVSIKDNENGTYTISFDYSSVK